MKRAGDFRKLPRHMRMRLGCAASLVLASLSCNTPNPAEPNPERLSCPSPHELWKDEGPAPTGCAFFDTDHDKDYADLTVCAGVGPPVRTEVRIPDGTTFRVYYNGIVPISWDRRGNPSPSALEVAPPELSRVIPSLHQPVEPSCLAEPQVSAYLGELRDRAQGRWMPPSERTGEQTVVVHLSLSPSGEITGACFEPTVSDSVGASAIRALQKAAPFAPLIPGPESAYETQTTKKNSLETKTEKLTHPQSRTGCLAGRRVIASLTTR